MEEIEEMSEDGGDGDLLTQICFSFDFSRSHLTGAAQRRPRLLPPLTPVVGGAEHLRSWVTCTYPERLPRVCSSLWHSDAHVSNRKSSIFNL
jgi:hypothetical protein